MPTILLAVTPWQKVALVIVGKDGFKFIIKVCTALEHPLLTAATEMVPLLFPTVVEMVAVFIAEVIVQVFEGKVHW